ncbi:hypothetical protein [Candidimonas sp. SYP-B2681]|uniref:hypothetical protein n=1 Tax=Candidimonas sp. SYP-B2681 TaxID=2497686 RepID=UPI001F2F142C|nr:hypothetical protein [Candidimonas sp. SYP-B2681]
MNILIGRRTSSTWIRVADIALLSNPLVTTSEIIRFCVSPEIIPGVIPVITTLVSAAILAGTAVLIPYSGRSAIKTLSLTLPLFSV